MQSVTTVIHRGIYKPYNIDVDGDIETALDLSASPHTFQRHFIREENGANVLRLTHPQPNDHIRLTEARRQQKDLERRLQIVEDRAQTQDTRYFEFKEAEARLGREENRLRQEADRLRQEEDLRREADRLRQEENRRRQEEDRRRQENDRLREEEDRLRQEENRRRQEDDRRRQENDRLREEKDRLHEEEKVSALNYETAERFSRGITDALIRMEPWIEYYILHLSQAVCDVSLRLGHAMAYLPNVLVAWYYHRAISNSSSYPPYPILTQQLPPFLHEKNISAANALQQISIDFDLGPLTQFVLAHIEKVALLVDTWIFRSILGCQRNEAVHVVPPADFASALLLLQNRKNSSHRHIIRMIMPTLLDVPERSGRNKYFASV